MHGKIKSSLPVRRKCSAAELAGCPANAHSLIFLVSNATLVGMTLNFTAYIEKDMESGMYVGTVPNLPGAHTFAESIDDLRNKLVEVIMLCLEEMDQFAPGNFA